MGVAFIHEYRNLHVVGGTTRRGNFMGTTAPTAVTSNLRELIDGRQSQLDCITLVVSGHHYRHEPFADVALGRWGQPWPQFLLLEPPDMRARAA